MLALILLFVLAVTTLKLTELAPAGTATFGGTFARAGLLLLSATTNPPGGAALLNVMVPTEFEPPTTVVGFKARDERTAGAAAFTAIIADLVTPE